MSTRAALALTWSLLACACARNNEPRAPEVDAIPDRPDTEPAALTSARVVFETASGEVNVAVEVVRKQRDIRRGLMYRTHLPEDVGMLFLFDREKMQSFWMKNTLMSLDMIFIRADMTVAGVRDHTPPRTLDSQQVETPSQFVLEVNAGWAAEHGVAAGTPVRFVDVGSVPPAAPMSSP